MKKLLLAAMLLLSTVTFAQNIQQHYDFDREMFTTTIEKFQLDKYGSTFFFIDLNYGSGKQQEFKVKDCYWEIARSFKIGNLPFEPRVEYNSGNFSAAWLAGVQKTWLSKDFSKSLTLQLNYKYIPHVEDASFQLTAVWALDFFKHKLTCSGFADFWKEKVPVFKGKETSFRDYVFITEPQVWYNVNKKLSLGSEIEISNNFAGHKGFNVAPTLAVKWNFDN